MKLKKLAAALLTASIMLSQPVFAEDKLSNGSSEGYDYFAKLMTYASQLYIDEDVTAEEICGRGFGIFGQAFKSGIFFA